MELANGWRSYPGRGPSGENTPASGPTGGWQAWWTGSAPAGFPPVPANGIAWFYGAGAIQYFYARDPKADLRSYRIEDHAQRVREVSALMDSTDPDLRPSTRRRQADPAGKPGRLRAEPVCRHRLPRDRGAAPGPAATVDAFFKLYTAPNVDHVGTGAPANADLLPRWSTGWSRASAPAGLQLVEQEARPPFAVRAQPAAVRVAARCRATAVAT